MTFLPPIDSQAEHVDAKGRPSKDFYNWIRSISETINKGFQSLVVGNPAGGNKGFGSINAESIYVGGVPLNPVTLDPDLHSDLPIVVVSASANISSVHKAKAILLQGAAAGQSLTIQTKAAGGLAQGATVTIENYTAQNWLLIPASGVTLSWPQPPAIPGGTRTLTPYAVVTLHAVIDDQWSLTGIGIT